MGGMPNLEIKDRGSHGSAGTGGHWPGRRQWFTLLRACRKLVPAWCEFAILEVAPERG